MALTQDQLNILEYQTKLAEPEAKRQLVNQRIDALKTAKDILTENRRTKPLSEAKDITVEEMIEMAEDLLGFAQNVSD